MAENSKWQFQSNLQITGSFGYEATVEVDKKRQISLGVAKEAIQVTDHKTKKSRWFNFNGLGGGFSVGKSLTDIFGYSASDTRFPCKGSYFYAGILNYGEVELNELDGTLCTVYTGSIGGNGALSGTLFMINPVPIVPSPVAWHSIAWVAGLSVGTSLGGGSIMQYNGILSS